MSDEESTPKITTAINILVSHPSFVIIIVGILLLILGSISNLSIGTTNINLFDTPIKVAILIFGIIFASIGVALLVREQVPGWIGGKVKVHEDFEKISHLTTYDFSYIQEDIVKKFGKNVGFLVIQFGSSVVGTKKPNDEDYIILIHGNLKEEKLPQFNIPNKKSDEVLAAPSIDIHIRGIDSLFFAIVMGKPFDMSVAQDGKFIAAFQMESDYWEWIRAMSNNIRIDRKYLIERINFDLIEIKREFVKKSEEKEYLSIIILAYQYICSMIQVNCLERIQKTELTKSDIYPLSKVDYLESAIKNPKIKILFRELVNYFKGKEFPSNFLSFQQKVYTLREYFETENIQ